MRRLTVALTAALCLSVSTAHARLNALAGDPQWLSMLHFDRDGLFDQPRSAVLDNDFFLPRMAAILLSGSYVPP